MIEICVLGFQRIEVHSMQMNAALSGLITLRKFQLQADTGVPIFLCDRHHLRIPIRHAGLDTRHGVQKSDKLIAVKCAKYQSANASSEPR